MAAEEGRGRGGGLVVDVAVLLLLLLLVVRPSAEGVLGAALLFLLLSLSML